MRDVYDVTTCVYRGGLIFPLFLRCPHTTHPYRCLPHLPTLYTPCLHPLHYYTFTSPHTTLRCSPLYVDCHLHVDVGRFRSRRYTLTHPFHLPFPLTLPHRYLYRLFPVRSTRLLHSFDLIPPHFYVPHSTHDFVHTVIDCYRYRLPTFVVTSTYVTHVHVTVTFHLILVLVAHSPRSFDFFLPLRCVPFAFYYVYTRTLHYGDFDVCSHVIALFVHVALR